VKPEAYSDVRCFRWVKSHKEAIVLQATVRRLAAAIKIGAVQLPASALRINTSPAGYYGEILLGFRPIEEPVEAAGCISRRSWAGARIGQPSTIKLSRPAAAQ
jgi:hypothetical protein